MIPFRERNPVPIGLVGLTVLALLMVAAFKVESLPVVGGGEVYKASFTDAAGLYESDEVRVAGVRIGEVEDMVLAGDHVVVSFRLTEPVQLGRLTEAAIRIKTVLGRKYLALEPRGPGDLDPDEPIPVARTESPYDVVPAFEDLSTTVEQIDTAQLAQAFNTMSATFENSPEEVRASIHGLSRLSRTVASRDAKLRELLDHANGVTDVLAARNEEFVKLLRDGDLLLTEVRKRREVIHRLLVGTVAVSQQLSGLVRDNEKQIGPALERLDSVVDLLQENQRNLDRTIAALAPFVRVFANVLGNGRWFDTYIPNLVPTPVEPQPPSGPPGVEGGAG